jgi:hypothetical protein
MKIEVVVPDAWTPELTLAVQELLQQAVINGYPLITVLCPDVTPDQLQDIDNRIQSMVRQSGLGV